MTSAAPEPEGAEPRERPKILHRWVWGRGEANLERCDRSGCTCERRVRSDSSANLYRASPTSAWTRVAPPCTGQRKPRR